MDLYFADILSSLTNIPSISKRNVFNLILLQKITCGGREEKKAFFFYIRADTGSSTLKQYILNTFLICNYGQKATRHNRMLGCPLVNVISQAILSRNLNHNSLIFHTLIHHPIPGEI